MASWFVMPSVALRLIFVLNVTLTLSKYHCNMNLHADALVLTIALTLTPSLAVPLVPTVILPQS